MKRSCRWRYRPGTSGTHFAFTPCRPGYNYLSKIGASAPRVGIADWYVGRLCPICGETIEMDYSLIEEVSDGSVD